MLKADVSDEGRPCFATFKEKQNPTKYGKSEKKEGAKVETPKKDERTYPQK
jgi:hypothetical protein